MLEKLQIYKCEICGDMTEVICAGKGQLACCNKPMILCRKNTTNTAREKHIPVVEKTYTGIKVKVGRIIHPMEQDHYIEWIEVITDDKADRRFLKPGDAPEAIFSIEEARLTVRAYCNLHGLWQD